MRRKRPTSYKTGGNPPGAGRDGIVGLYLEYSERKNERIKCRTADSEEQPPDFLLGLSEMKLCFGYMLE